MDTREHFATLKIKPEQYKQYIDEEIEEGSIHEDGFIYTDLTQIFDHPVSMNTKMTEENFLRFYGIDPSILTESGAEFTGWCNG
tara:strand:+ start:303 stop:554 length:252 start_codon:yes stop_codon:yes gene_type:complete